MLLVYYRMYLTYDLTGHLFGLDQSNVSRNIRYLEPAVKRSIPIPSKFYADSKKINDISQLHQFFPEFIAITDGTEQQIPRPKDRTKRKTHYSGKKKRHTIKNQITINLKGEIIHKPPHSSGRRNDFAILKIKHPVLSEDIMVFYDLGYLGVEKDFPAPCRQLGDGKPRQLRRFTVTPLGLERVHRRQPDPRGGCRVVE